MANRFIRTLEIEDLDVLKAIDEFYAQNFGLEPLISPGSLNFYLRSGHSFASLQDDEVMGFVLAHAVWNGYRPVVQVVRLAVRELVDLKTREVLLEALIKSAYDAAVYDLMVLQPATDALGTEILQKKAYREKPLLVFERLLGSRGQGG